ncbi:hypothetical protein K466DRAFT_605393, partial [Polyporus arcularius HHB13444]
LSTAPAPVSREGSPVALVHARVPAPAQTTVLGASPSAPEVLLAGSTRLPSTIEASYTGPPGWAARSDDHAAVSNKTNIVITTTASYIMRVLGLRVSLAMPDHFAHSRDDDVVLREEELRAVYMKALVWFIERECLDGGSCHVVFVGGVDADCPDSVPAIPLDSLREMADQLPIDYRDAVSTADFEAFMFHAGAFYVEPHAWMWAFLVGLLMIVGAVTLVLTVRFLFTPSLFDTM